jgi:hypothetical protein
MVGAECQWANKKRMVCVESEVVKITAEQGLWYKYIERRHEGREGADSVNVY